MTCTGKKTGKDIFLYRFFLVLILFPSILNLVCLSHCKCENLMGAKNSKQLCWHNTVAIRESRAELLKKVKNDFKQSAKSSSQFYTNFIKRNRVRLNFTLKLFLTCFFKKSVSLLISCFEFSFCTSVKFRLLFHSQGFFCSLLGIFLHYHKLVMLGLQAFQRNVCFCVLLDIKEKKIK